MGDLVFEDPGSVVEGSEDMDGVLFGRGDYFVFDVLVDRASWSEVWDSVYDGVNGNIADLIDLSTVHMNRVPKKNNSMSDRNTRRDD